MHFWNLEKCIEHFPPYKKHLDEKCPDAFFQSAVPPLQEAFGVKNVAMHFRAWKNASGSSHPTTSIWGEKCPDACFELGTMHLDSCHPEQALKCKKCGRPESSLGSLRPPTALLRAMPPHHSHFDFCFSRSYFQAWVNARVHFWQEASGVRNACPDAFFEPGKMHLGSFHLPYEKHLGWKMFGCIFEFGKMHLRNSHPTRSIWGEKCPDAFFEPGKMHLCSSHPTRSIWGEKCPDAFLEPGKMYWAFPTLQEAFGMRNDRMHFLSLEKRIRAILRQRMHFPRGGENW